MKITRIDRTQARRDPSRANSFDGEITSQPLISPADSEELRWSLPPPFSRRALEWKTSTASTDTNETSKAFVSFLASTGKVLGGSSHLYVPVLATSIICSKKGLGQQDEEDAIGLGGRWPFHLPFEDTELLA